MLDTLTSQPYIRARIKIEKKKYYLYLNSAARGVDNTTAQARSNFDSEVQDLIIPVNG